MAILPFRGLAERGILHDPSPYQLDLNAWSGGSNVRFHGNKAMRSPIWRGVVDLVTVVPVHAVGYRPSTGFDYTFVLGATGRTYKFINQASTDVSSTDASPITDHRTINSTFLGDVTYINRPDVGPHYYGPGSLVFATLPGWDPTWSCRSLRAYGNYLIALNVTKASNTIKNMVKWSDLTLAGLPPGSWDATDPTKNAGENVLEDMTSPIVDGCVMRNAFIIYSGEQVWSMTQTGNQSIFQFRRIFSEGGLIAPNCVVEVAGKHYCFGTSDIYVHDGTTKQSLIDQRNRDYVFRSLNMRATEVCFASYFPQLNEIVFAYQTGVADAAFAPSTYCNRGAVYNIPGNTWSFIDLPNVSAMTLSNINVGVTYTLAGARNLTYGNTGSTYYDQESGFDQHVIAVSVAVPGLFSTNRMLAYDFMNKGAVAFPFVAECNAPAFLERIGLDLDQVGSDLVTYKNARRVYPLVTMFGNEPVSVEVGGSLTPAGNTVWAPAVLFNPVTQYKVDIQKGGRYLAVRFTVTHPADFEVNGFDVDVSPGGRR